MKCNCISEIESRATKKFKESGDFKKTIKSVRMKGNVYGITDSGLIERTVTELEVEMEGQKKKSVVKMAHTYCPFCGVSQTPDKKEEQQ